MSGLVTEPSVLWRNRPYLFLISAQVISNLGDWLYILALFLLVGVRWHGSPAMLTMTMLCLTGPNVVLGPFTGVLADRLNRTALMMGSNLVMAVLIGSIPSLHHRWELFLVLLLAGSFQSLFAPAEQGRLKEIVPDDQMDRAVPVNTGISQFAKIVGPGLSGALVSVFGSNMAFYLDAVSFVLSTVLLLFTGVHSMPARVVKAGALDEPTQSPEGTGSSKAEPESFLQRSKAGWSFIASKRLLWSGALLLVVIILVLQMTDSQFITLLRLLPHMSANLFGDAMAASGAGALISAVLMGKLRPRNTVVWMAMGALGIGVGFGVEAVVVRAGLNQWITIAPAFIAGGCATLGFLPFQTVAQRETPEHLIGRVFGVIGSATTGAALIGPVLGGVLVTEFGAISGFLVTGIVLTTIGIVTFFSKRWMEEEHCDVPESDGSVQERPTT